MRSHPQGVEGRGWGGGCYLFDLRAGATAGPRSENQSAGSDTAAPKPVKNKGRLGCVSMLGLHGSSGAQRCLFVAVYFFFLTNANAA